MDQKWTRNGPETDQKRTRNGPKMDLELWSIRLDRFACFEISPMRSHFSSFYSKTAFWVNILTIEKHTLK